MLNFSSFWSPTPKTSENSDLFFGLRWHISIKDLSEKMNVEVVSKQSPNMDSNSAQNELEQIYEQFLSHLQDIHSSNVISNRLKTELSAYLHKILTLLIFSISKYSRKTNMG